MVEITSITHSNLLSHLHSLKSSLKNIQQACSCRHISICIQNSIIETESMIRFLNIIDSRSCDSMSTLHEPSNSCSLGSQGSGLFCYSSVPHDPENVMISRESSLCHNNSFVLRDSLSSFDHDTSVNNEFPIHGGDDVRFVLERSLAEHDRLELSLNQVEGKLSDLFTSVYLVEKGCGNVASTNISEAIERENVSNVQMKLNNAGQGVESLLQDVEHKKARMKARQNKFQENLSDLRRSLEISDKDHEIDSVKYNDNAQLIFRTHH